MFEQQEEEDNSNKKKKKDFDNNFIDRRPSPSSLSFWFLALEAFVAFAPAPSTNPSQGREENKNCCCLPSGFITVGHSSATAGTPFITTIIVAAGHSFVSATHQQQERLPLPSVVQRSYSTIRGFPTGSAIVIIAGFYFIYGTHSPRANSLPISNAIADNKQRTRATQEQLLSLFVAKRFYSTLWIVTLGSAIVVFVDFILNYDTCSSREKSTPSSTTTPKPTRGTTAATTTRLVLLSAARRFYFTTCCPPFVLASLLCLLFLFNLNYFTRPSRIPSNIDINVDNNTTRATTTKTTTTTKKLIK